MNPSLPITMIDEEGVETIVALPARYEICPHCSGKGSTSAHLGAYSSDEMDEEGPEFLEDYLAGAYDRPCDDCLGSPGRVLVVDESRVITDEQKKALRYMIDLQGEMDELRAIEAAERRAGA